MTIFEAYHKKRAGFLVVVEFKLLVISLLSLYAYHNKWRMNGKL